MGSCSTSILNCYYPFFLLQIEQSLGERVCRKQQVGAAGVALDIIFIM